MQNNKGLQNNGTDSDELSNPLSAGKRNDGMQQLLSSLPRGQGDGEDRSGLEDKCSPLLHPWGLAARSLLCSRSQHHRDLMELKALQLHSTYLMQGIEAKPSI